MASSARTFSRLSHGLLGPGEALLLGADLVKDPARLEAAYNDSRGVTAEFNRNVLHVINGELGGDFDVERFEHLARWDAENEWIEMLLRADADQRVHIDALDLEVEIAAGEEIRTEDLRQVPQGGFAGRARWRGVRPGPVVGGSGWRLCPSPSFSAAGR